MVTWQPGLYMNQNSELYIQVPLVQSILGDRGHAALASIDGKEVTVLLNNTLDVPRRDRASYTDCGCG